MSNPKQSRRVLLMAVFASLCVAVPFLGWEATWFGRPLTPGEIDGYLAQSGRPRKVQHALSQIADRIQRGDAGATRWYPRVVELSRDPLPAIRNTAAWVMGQDNTAPLFHHALLAMLADPDPMVRRNAALALVRFGDAAGRAELVAILEPYTIRAPEAGNVAIEVSQSAQVGAGTVLARIRRASGEVAEVRSPFAGSVAHLYGREGQTLASGAPILSIRADSSQVWEALRALYLVGGREDLAPVERQAASAERGAERVREQAVLTARAIRTRSEPNPSR